MISSNYDISYLLHQTLLLLDLNQGIPGDDQREFLKLVTIQLLFYLQKE